MMTELTACPGCGTKLKSGMFSVNNLLSDERLELIAEFTRTPKKIGCDKCTGPEYFDVLTEFRKRRTVLQDTFRNDLDHIPLATTHSPYNWQYQVLGFATGQSTIGTGLFSELAASWTDMLGMQSESYNRKIAAGEAHCATQLRGKAIQMGGNAIIGLDIDYAELGGDKGMIMVCMSGTVVKLSNMDVLEQAAVDAIERIGQLKEQLFEWERKYPAVLKE
ncbi:heavy metal-binding domain-containing protein [Chitinophaga rhizophila]|uniref:Heavy metal-binding domain-containing protein n=1 Tax=Chitinophaga rhizophila TaxID=2866212 RepID=A0ABS7GJM7_9BACT|nr:heavy metal-binding domain-containing protein [Chitinophaga rhizophila]MBW8687923.1 heavy metal-binding domain-containing protein [Chitinophaga rhizophila]